jgi:phage terminase small subunit
MGINSRGIVLNVSRASTRYHGEKVTEKFTQMKTKSVVVPAPAHLGDTMQAFYIRLTGEFDFSQEHLAILQLGCEQFDLCQAAREAVARDGMVVSGKRHPLLSVIAKSTELFLRAVKDLALEKDANATL